MIWTVDGTTFESDTSLPEGPQTISASAQDAAGNTGTDQVAITVDRTAPVVRISSPLNGLFTNKTPIAVAWTVDGVEQTTQLSADLTEGGNSITRTATDVAGNTGSALVGLTLDTQSPLITILSPSNNLLTNSPEIHWVWSIDGVTDSLDTMLIGDGLHTLVRSAFDAAGNVGSDTVRLTLATSSKIVEILSPQNGSILTSSSTVFSVNELAVGARSIAMLVDGADQTSAFSKTADMFSATLILGDGHHTFHLLTENGAGIRDTQRVSFKIKTSTAPSQIQISGTVVDAKTLQPVAGATVLVSGEIVVSTGDDGTFSIGSGGFGSIILSATKNRYTKAVRTINAIAGVDVALAPILVMPQQTDSVVVPASGDTTIALPGSNVQLDFPLNALSEQTTVSATVFDQIEQLPGEQPGMDVFLFGVDLQPHGTTFTQPVTVRVPNGRQLSAGAEVPITYFNEQTGIWESVGIGMVTMDGAFVEFQTMHFSVFHGNWHIGGNGLPPNKFVLGLPPCPPGTCCLEDKGSSTITVAHGDLSNGVMIAGGPGFGDISVGLQYWSNTAKPRKVISLRLDTMPFTPTYMNWKLSLPGKDIQWLFYGPPEPTSLQYIWDATDKDGQLLPSGLYPFGERVSSIMMPGRYQYRFGAAENLYVNYTTPMVTKSYYYDFIPLVNRQASPYGAGWGIDGVLQIVGKKSTLPAEYPTTNGFRALGSQTRTSSLAGGAPVDSVALSTAMGANQGSSSGNHVMIAGTSSQGLIYWHKDGTNIYTPPYGMHDTLYQFSTYWMRRLSDGTVEEFDTLGVITRRINPKGFAVRYEWDTFRERLVRIVDEKTQRATELLYDSRDKLAAVRDQFGRLTTIAVDNANDLVEVRTPDNVATHRFIYDTNHRMVDKKYAGGEGSHYVYDQWGAVAKAVNKDSLEKTFIRTADVAIVNTLAPVASDAVEGYIHSNSGSVPDYSSQPVHPMASCPQNEYSVIDQENNKKTYLINSFGSTVSSSSADGATTRYGYAPGSCCGNVDTTIFPNQTRVIKESDARGNLLRTYNTATQAETRYTYQSIGSSDYVKTVTNALGQITRFNYDGFGNVISIVAPGGDSTSMTYTSDHLPQTVTDPQGRTTRTEYDSLGRVVRKIDAARNVTTYEYDDFGNLGAMYAPDGRKTWYEYDNMSRLTAEHDPAGGVTHYSYQADGRLESLIDAKGQATRFTYNSQGRLASSTNARGLSRHYEYDHSGALISFTNARGQKIRYSYDELGRLISKTDTLGNVLALFNYDAMGNMNYAATPEYVINRGFDGASRLLQEIVSHASEPDTIVMADTIGAYDNRYEYKDVIISGQTVVIDGAHTFASLVLRNGAIVKHLPTTGTQVHSLSVVATDSIVIDSSSKIDVTGLGYLGGRRGDNASTIGRTVGNRVSGGSSPGSGGSHGGMGGAYYYNGTIGVAASVYGAKLRPVLPGGGGGSNGQPGYNGGGVVYLSAPRIRVSGSIVANGESALNENGGAGAGGSIIVETDSLKGFGIIAAHGGAGGIGNGAPMGGGGGRIFVSAQAWEPILLEPQGGLNGGVRGTLAIKSATGLVVENITIDSNETISATDDRYDGHFLQISNAQVVIDGKHSFKQLSLVNNALITTSSGTDSSASPLIVKVAGALFIDSTSGIDVSGKGYVGQIDTMCAKTMGYACGATGNSGGSHGSLGGNASGFSGFAYGSIVFPTQFGAGGAATSGKGGNGGGALQLHASSIRNNGYIWANGTPSDDYMSGGGAGGSIIINADTLFGKGTISAHGATSFAGGGGSGGRIALIRANFPVVYLQGIHATGGYSRNGTAMNGGPGSLYVERFDSILVDSINPGATTYVLRHNDTLASTDYSFENANVVIDGATIVMDGCHFFKSLKLQNGAVLSQLPTSLDSAKKLVVFVRDSLIVGMGTKIDVSGCGYLGDAYVNELWRGPRTLDNVAYGGSAASGCTGGSNGGTGSGYGSGVTTNSLYGTFYNPNELGSGGGCFRNETTNFGAAGGGLVRLYAKTIDLKGSVLANGSSSTRYGGGGSGGGIFISADTVRGNGTISSNGSDGYYSSDAAGGRIAVYGKYVSDSLTLTAMGSSENAGNGTAFVYQGDSLNGTIELRNPAVAGSSYPVAALIDSTDTFFEGRNITIKGHGLEVRGQHQFGVVVARDARVNFYGNIIVDSMQLSNSFCSFDTTITVLGGLSIHANSTITHRNALETRTYNLQLQAERVYVDPSSSIDVSGRGYLGDAYVNGLWRGPRTLDNVAYGGSAASGCTGGSNGGTGSVYGSGVTTNSLYGTFYNPNELGSGGGCFRNETTNFGAAGGGLVRLYAKTIDLKGSVLANGSSSTRYGGGGSGGGIFISADTVRGNGAISSNGSDGYWTSDAGGGRIAVYGKYVSDSLTLTAMGSSIHAGNGTALVYQGDSLNGTIELRNPAVAGSSYPVDALIDSTDTFFEGRNITIKGQGLEVRGQHQFGVVVARDARVNFYGNIIVDSMQLSNSFCSFDTTITVLGGLSMHSNSKITHRNALESRTYNLQLQAERVFVDASSSIDVSGRGYLGDAYVNGVWRGPRTLNNAVYGGSASSGCIGGTNGGIGSVYGSGVTPNAIYGNFYNPNELGSGGGCYRSETANFGAAGGGLVRLYAKTIDLKGSVLANGSSSTRYGGGGSGGGIFISADTVRGNGTISSNGSDGYWTSDAGGGRIAVYGKYVSDSLTFTALGSSNAGAGTSFLRDTSRPLGLLRIDNGGNASLANSTPIISIAPGTVTDLSRDTLFDTTKTFSPFVRSHLVKLNTNVVSYYEAFKVMDVGTHALKVDTSAGVLTNSGSVGSAYIGVYPFDSIVVSGGAKASITGLVFYNALYLDNGSFASYTGTQVGTLQHNGTIPDAIRMASIGSAIEGYQGAMRKCALPGSTSPLSFLSWPARPKPTLDSVKSSLAALSFAQLPHKMSNQVVFAPKTRAIKTEIAGVQNPGSLTRDSMAKNLEPASNSENSRIAQVALAAAIPPTCPAGDPIYTYDILDRVTSMTSPVGTTRYHYDALRGLLDTITTPQGKKFAYTYANGQLQSLLYPNGISAKYTFDNNGNLEDLHYQRSDMSSVQRFRYAYDTNNMRTSMSDNDGVHDYTYDSLYQIIGATHPTVANPLEQFAYDVVGNRLRDNVKSAYQYNELNQLMEDDSCTYAYDADGNMTSKVMKISGDSTVYTWDIENKLVQVRMSGMVAKYEYDALGRRMVKDVNGVVTQFRYDGENLIIEMDGNDSVTASYTFGMGTDNPLAMCQGDMLLYYIKDALGSVTALTDSVANLVKEYHYSIFGEMLSETGPSVSNPFMYTSREYEMETGILYLRGRYYEPGSGRFISQDPIGLRGGMNLYQYVRNAPNMFTDPFGLKWNTGSFLEHYYGGDGQAVNLNNPSVGLINDVMSRVQSSSQYSNAINSIKQTVSASAIAQCSKGSYSYSESGSRSFNVDLEASAMDPLFSLGNTNFAVKYKCSISCDKCGGYKFSCSLDFSLPSERFQDPVDIFDWFPGNQEAGGTPYSVVGGWSESLSGSGK